MFMIIVFKKCELFIVFSNAMMIRMLELCFINGSNQKSGCHIKVRAILQCCQGNKTAANVDNNEK